MRCARCGVHKRCVGPCGNCGARGGPYSLSDMELDEISFCESGVNPKAHVVLVKSDNPLDQLDATIQHLNARLGIPRKVPIFKLPTQQPASSPSEKVMEVMNKSETPEQASVNSLAAVAKALQDRDPRLSHAQAISKALEANPGLYDPDMPPPAPVAKQLEPELSDEVAGLAHVLQKSDPSLTREQAVLRALESEPTWYDEWELTE
jgi:hypothetical protein